MVGAGFEGDGIDRLMSPEGDREHKFLEDNHLEGRHGLEDGVSVSMLWTGS